MGKYYFDHAATTPMHPEVMKTMVGLMQGAAGNASSMHAYGRAAKGELSRARDLISAAVGCSAAKTT